MEMLTMGFVATVFAAGLLSFFSPCVLPILPVYFGYLSGGVNSAQEQDNTSLFKAFAFVAAWPLPFSFLVSEPELWAGS